MAKGQPIVRCPREFYDYMKRVGKRADKHSGVDTIAFVLSTFASDHPEYGPVDESVNLNSAERPASSPVKPGLGANDQLASQGTTEEFV